LQQQKLGTNLYHRLCCLLLFFVAASASFQGSYTKWHFREAGVLYGGGNTPDRRFDLGELITGTAERPFVYRQMLPTLANWIDRATPTGIKERAYAWAQGEKRVSGILRPVLGRVFRYLPLCLAGHLRHVSGLQGRRHSARRS
jgi:hypothetical protein